MVVLFLLGAYRSLGGASTRPVDPGVLLPSLHDQLAASVDELNRQLGSSERELDAGAAGRGRKRAAAVQQALDRIEPAGIDTGSADARALMSAAADDLSWAWRMLEAQATTPALAAAAAVLAAHAAECCEQARSLLRGSLLGEPADRA